MAIRGAGELGKYNFEFLPKILTSNRWPRYTFIETLLTLLGVVAWYVSSICN